MAPVQQTKALIKAIEILSSLLAINSFPPPEKRSYFQSMNNTQNCNLQLAGLH